MPTVSQLAPPTIAGTKLERYFHTCAFFQSAEEEYDVLGPFIREGLESGEKAVHIVDPTLRTGHLEQLAGSGVGVDELLASGQLAVMTWQETYLVDGRFDQDDMLRRIETAIQEGQTQGFPRARIIGHMEWALDGAPGAEDLIEYEVKVNDVLARHRQPAVCVYDVNRLSGRLLLDVLRSHPLTIVGAALHENPLFTPPEIMLRELRARRGN